MTVDQQVGTEVAVGRRRYVLDDPTAGIFRVHRDTYASSSVHERELADIFDRSWLFVGHESEVAEPNSYVTRQVAGRPLLMTRSDSGKLHVMINSCRHRGAEICRSPRGAARVFKCFYHGWPYSIDGRLIGVPGRESYPEEFDFGELDLARPPKVASHRGFVFCAFDPAICSLEDYLGRAADYLDLVADHSPSGMEVISGTHEYGIDANWKLLVENSLDGYHLGPLHTTYFQYLVSQGDPVEAQRATEAHDLGSGHALIVDRAPWPRPTARWKPSLGEDMRPLIEERARELHGRLGAERATQIAETDRNLLVFPNLVINDIMAVTIRVIWPTSPTTMTVLGWALAPRDDTAALRAKTIQNFTSFLGPAGFASPDDIEALESVQRTMSARNEAPWSDISRGYASDGPHRSDDEVQTRAFWREWARRIEGTEGR